MTIELGDRVRDKVTGLTGIAMGRSEYLWGCVHVLVQPQETKDGKRVESSWLDEGGLEVMQRGAIADQAAPSGGPSIHPAPPAR